jgi:amino acid transporter, AAT family
MSNLQPDPTETLAPTDVSDVLSRERGLHRNLSSRQLSMIAVGGAIGTGLFLGSAISVRVAGPGVILSYTFASAIALALMWALGEMTLAHPVAGSFGVHAEIYLHPWAGFAMRYSYWLGQVIAIGSEMVAASIYCKHWFPGDRWVLDRISVGERSQRLKFRRL